MSVLVLGGTGTVGSAVVDGLLERSEEVRVLTRSPEKAARLPEDVEPVVGDLRDPGTYPSVFSDLDRVFLLNGVTDTELQQGLAALNESVRAGASRIVYLSVHEARRAPHVPHFAAKVAIEEALDVSGVPYTVLRPNNFFQNDLWLREAIVEHGVYPQPIGGVGVSRVDVRDVADAAVAALTGEGHAGRTYAIVGAEELTGEDCARAYSEALGREVRYGGDDLEAWERRAREAIPHWMAYDFRLMYSMFQEEGFLATREHLRETVEVTGHEPRRFEDFVREAVTAWS